MMVERKETASWHPALQWFVVSTYTYGHQQFALFSVRGFCLHNEKFFNLSTLIDWFFTQVMHVLYLVSVSPLYYPVLHVNIVFILNFIVPLVGWGTDQLTGFGEERGTKHQVINLIHSVRTVMRSKFTSWSPKHEPYLVKPRYSIWRAKGLVKFVPYKEVLLRRGSFSHILLLLG